MSDMAVRASAEGVLISGRTPGGDPLPEALPLDRGGASPLPRWLRVVDLLWTEERIEARPDEGVLLPWTEAYALDEADRRALGLPDPVEKLDVELRAQSFPSGRGDFAIQAVCRTADGELLPKGSRHGPLFSLGDTSLLAPPDAWALLKHLDDRPGPELADQHLYLAEAKRLAERCGATLDRFLSDQEYLTPAAIGLEVEGVGPDEIHLHPTLEGVEEDFPTLTHQGGPVRSTYSKREGTRRRRLVLSRQQRETVGGLRKRAVLRGPDVPRFLENPEAFLPDEIDLSRFSPRVTGVIPQRYQSQPYLEVNRGQSRDWFSVSPRIELLGEDEPTAEPAGAIVERSSSPSTAPTGSSDGSASTPSPPDEVTPEEYRDLCEEVLETGERHVRHGNRWITIEPAQAERYLEVWGELEAGEGGYTIPAHRVGYVLDVISNVDQLDFTSAAPQPVVEPPDYPRPPGLRADLYPHQEFGYRWLRFLSENGYGGLLADDMGLGKTIQVLALLAFLHEEDTLRPSLVVLPKSLIGNWKRELRKFCPSIGGIHVHHGTDRIRKPEFLAQWDVVFTTYGTLRRDQLALGQVEWKVLACDEAQNVKNPTAQITSAVKGMNARLKLALTGTPVENGLSELWCIVDFVQPGRLGSRQEFRDTFERPMLDAPDDRRRFDLSKELQTRLDPHYVRRKKEDVLADLPEKREQRYPVPFGERQARLYASIRSDLKAGRSIAIEAIQKLIQVCSHPELIQPTGIDAEAAVRECPKLEETVRILDRVRAQREKALVFTRYRQMQLILQDVIAERFGIHAPVINGESGSDRRLDLVDRFNGAQGFGVLILSPEAAGVGLNITGANHVVHYTRLWNPAKEMQATDRVYRLGQTRDVTVHYPIVSDDDFHSVEQHLDELLAEKAELAANVLWPRESLSVSADLQRAMEREG